MGTQYKNHSKNKGGKSNKQWNTKKKGSQGKGFKGSVSDMKGNVFQCHGEANVANQFNQTMEALETYVSANFNEQVQQYMRHVIKYNEKPAIKRPANPPDMNDLFEVEVWKKKIDAYVKTETLLDQCMCKLYMTVWAQCSEAMKSKIRGTEGYTKMDKDLDVITLLKVIKGVSMHFDNQTYIPKSLDDAKKLFYSMKQGEHESHPAFHKRFCNHVEVIEHYGGELGADPILLKLERDFLARKGQWPPAFPLKVKEGTTPRQVAEKEQADYELVVLKRFARDRYLAIAYLTRCDPVRVGDYVNELHNDYIKGVDNHPADLTHAYNAVINYRPKGKVPNKGKRQQRDDNTQDRGNTDSSRDTAESNDDEDDTPLEDINLANIEKGKSKACWICGSEDHLMPECPKKKAWDEFMKDPKNGKKGIQMATMGGESDDEDNANNEEFDGGFGNLMFVQVTPKKQVQLITPTQSTMKSMKDRGVPVNPN